MKLKWLIETMRDGNSKKSKVFFFLFLYFRMISLIFFLHWNCYGVCSLLSAELFFFFFLLWWSSHGPRKWSESGSISRARLRNFKQMILFTEVDFFFFYFSSPWFFRWLCDWKTWSVAGKCTCSWTSYISNSLIFQKESIEDSTFLFFPFTSIS